MTGPRPAVARVTHEFGASAARVFDAWLDPEKVPLWWRLSAAAAGRGATESIERVRTDARVGGTFSILVRRAGQLIDHSGTYLEIDRPRRLVFTWAAMHPDWAAFVDRAANAWTLMLEAIGDLLIEQPEKLGSDSDYPRSDRRQLEKF